MTTAQNAGTARPNTMARLLPLLAHRHLLRHRFHEI